MKRQCILLGVARSSVGYETVPEGSVDLKIKALLDKICLDDPCLGSRRLVTVLERDHGVKLNRQHLQRLRREKGHGAAALLAANSNSQTPAASTDQVSQGAAQALPLNA